MEDPFSPKRSMPPAVREPLTIEQATVRHLSERLVALQRGLRVLEHVSWDAAIEHDFFAHDAQTLPQVPPDYYRQQSLSVDVDSRRAELRELERDIRRRLGVSHVAAQLLLRRCRESRLVLDLLASRGTAEFGPLSERLYGPAPSGEGLAGQLHRLADRLGEVVRSGDEVPCVEAEEASRLLRDRLVQFFGSDRLVRVRLADDLVANAAATLDTLKIRRNARFTPREVRLLEVHEGWIHLGTTINGQSQPVCTFLSKCVPSTTTTQEGLAVLVEVLAGVSHQRRLDRLALRVEGITWARQGANFLEVYRAFGERGLAPREAYQQTVRIFRGVPVMGGSAFVKDACYARGFVTLARWLRSGDQQTREDLALLTVGKTRKEELPLLKGLLEMDLLRRPRFVPPVFQTPRSTEVEGAGSIVAPGNPILTHPGVAVLN